MNKRKVIRVFRFLLIPIYLYLIYVEVFMKNAAIGLDENWYLSKFWDESYPSIFLSCIIIIVFTFLTVIDYWMKKRETNLL